MGGYAEVLVVPAIGGRLSVSRLRGKPSASGACSVQFGFNYLSMRPNWPMPAARCIDENLEWVGVLLGQCFCVAPALTCTLCSVRIPVSVHAAEGKKHESNNEGEGTRKVTY